MRRLIYYPFELATGTGDTVVELPPFDFSRAKLIKMVVVLTGVGAGGDVGDTLNIYLQESGEGLVPIWSDRIAVHQFNAAMTVSAAAPEVRELSIDCDNVAGGEAIYEPSGSAGATRLVAPNVINGKLKPPRRIAGVNGKQSRHRLSFEAVDADSDAVFAGTIEIYIDSEGND